MSRGPLFGDIWSRLVILFSLRTDCPSDRPSIQSRARPTDSPSRLTETQNKYCVGCYDIYSIHSHYKGNHKRGGAAEGRATSFVVAANGRHLCILALNRVNIVAVNTIIVVHVGVIGYPVPRQSCFMLLPYARCARGVRGALLPR